MRRGLVCLLATCALPMAPALAQDGGASEPDILVTAPGVRSGDGETVTVGQAAISRTGPPDLIGGLTRKIAGLSISDAQNNPFQPNLVYHGFTASPLQGNAQGLAVYLDGGRFNQPFGDTVDFDLLPSAAIASVTIDAGSPIYGLNALGGAVIVATKTGRTAPGLSLWGAGGNFGWAEGGVQAGWSHGGWSAFAAIQQSHDAGWRRYSPSTLYNSYADVGFDGPSAGLHLKLVGADSDLTGNGSSPVELLAADRRAVFTAPDTTRNRYGRLSLHPWLALGQGTRIEGSAYAQRLHQTTVNGDAADIAACDDDAELLCLENAQGVSTNLLDTHGLPVVASLPEDAPYGVLNRSTTRTSAAGALIQVQDRRYLWGGENLFLVGISHDRSRTDFASLTELGALSANRNVIGFGSGIDQADGAIAPVGLRTRSAFTAGFASDRLPLTDHLRATLNLRYDIARIELDDRLGTALDGRHRFGRLNPGAVLAYTASPALTLDLGYAETSRAPTPAELSCASPEAPCSLTNFFVGDPALKQVVARTWTLGGSGMVRVSGWTAHWHAAGYRGVNQDDIQFIAAAVRGRAYFQNIGTTRRQGIDASLAATKGRWTVDLGYAFTDATFRAPLRMNSPDNPAAASDGSILVGTGYLLPGVPRHRGTVLLDYAGPSFGIGANMQFQSGQYLFGDEANLQPRTAAFALVGAHASVRLANSLTLFASVTNLFDKDYATFGTFGETNAVTLSEAPGARDPRSLGPGAPRRWKTGLRVTL